MTDEKLLARVSMNPSIMTGKPVIHGTRLTVEFILNLLAHGQSTQEIINEYKGLTLEDVQACMLFASKTMENTVFMPLTVDNP
jgi:uncharacterized protein (DUF433 family)